MSEFITDRFNRKHPNLAGKTLGDHLVLQKSKKPEHVQTTGNYWECRCVKCGNVSTMPSRALTRGLKCPECCQKLPNNKSALNSLIWRYKKSAKKRSLDFALSVDDFDKLFKGNCSYCGRAPSQLVVINSSKYLYNGVDRLNPDFGYVPGNVATCCKTCNLRKGKMGLAEFAAWIALVHKNLNQKNTSSKDSSGQDELFGVFEKSTVISNQKKYAYRN